MTSIDSGMPSAAHEHQTAAQCSLVSQVLLFIHAFTAVPSKLVVVYSGSKMQLDHQESATCCQL